MNPQQSLSDILTTSKVVAVIGLSPKAHRASYSVAQYLQKHGYRIVPVNPAYAGQLILGEQCHASLEDAAVAVQHIDIVDCFRKSEDIMPLVEEAIAIHARCLWMQLGIENEAAAEKARAAGLQVVKNHCIKIEHAALFR